MSSATDLKIAEMLAQEKTYREITKTLHVGAETIKKVKDQWLSGIIVVNEEGKAILAKPAAKTIEEIHSQVMDVVTKKATKVALENAENDYALGNEIRQYWILKAQETGMELRDYVRAALIFYDDYKDELETMQEKVAVAKTVMEMLKRDLVRTTRMELYYKFVRYCLFLRSRGMQITPEVVHDFYQDLATLEKGGELAVMGVQEIA